MRKWIFYPVLASAGFVLPFALMNVATAETPQEATAPAGEPTSSPQATGPAELEPSMQAAPSMDEKEADAAAPKAESSVAGNAPTAESSVAGDAPTAESPSVAGDASKTPDVSAAPSPEVYVVKEGDTLGDIAREQLGSVEAWTEIAELNGIEHPEALAVGTRLELPVN